MDLPEDDAPTTQKFHHNPLYVIVLCLSEVATVLPWTRLIRGGWVRPLAKAWLVGAILAVGQVTMVPVIVRFWRSSWTFTLTPTHLLATHQFRRTRVSIPWESVASVTIMPPIPIPASRMAPYQFSRISSDAGAEIIFGPHLIHYHRFLSELQRRAVKCRVFAPFVY